MDYIIIKLLLYIAKVITFGNNEKTKMEYYDLQGEIKKEMEALR